jgi:hypothetical protein
VKLSFRSALIASALASWAAACGRTPPPSPPAGETARFGAALAYVTVENQTDHALTILFRLAAGAGGDVGVGRVDPGTSNEMAPVPAGEAIVLIARVAELGDYGLPARSFDIGERWRWVIPADAAFRNAEE